MKKYPKLVQCDKRGQIVIPKEIRLDLNVEEGTGFFVYSITDEGILLKKVTVPVLSNDDNVIKVIRDKSSQIPIDLEKMGKSIDNYKQKQQGGLDLI